MNPDTPFTLRGGENESSALRNRAEAIARIKFLSGVDLTKKDIGYLKALDVEMWTRWYINEPKDKPIDEEFCQRAAEVTKSMESNGFTPDEKKYKNSKMEYEEKLNDNDDVKDSTEDARRPEEDVQS